MGDLTGGELVARVLKQAGVGHVFTLCGCHILPIYDGCVKDGIGVIDVRHEQAGQHCAEDALDHRVFSGGWRRLRASILRHCETMPPGLRCSDCGCNSACKKV